MRRLLIAFALVTCSALPAGATSLTGVNMPQPNSPIQVVGCSGEFAPKRNGPGSAVTMSSSFRSVGPRTASQVRIGFAFFDTLGKRKLTNGITAGKFSPGVRIDLPPFAARVGAQIYGLVCFATEASFTDGSYWQLPRRDYPDDVPNLSPAPQ